MPTHGPYSYELENKRSIICNIAKKIRTYQKPVRSVALYYRPFRGLIKSASMLEKPKNRKGIILGGPPSLAFAML